MNRYDQSLIAALIAFVNLRRIATTEQVESLFRKASGNPRLQVIPPGDVQPYLKDQKRAVDALAAVIAFPKKSPQERQALLERIRATVRDKVHSVADFSISGSRPALRWTLILDGVEACVCYALAVLLSDPAARRRVGLCAMEECGRFFFDQRERGGRQQAYCSTAHSTRDRVRRLRRRRKVSK